MSENPGGWNGLPNDPERTRAHALECNYGEGFETVVMMWDVTEPNEPAWIVGPDDAVPAWKMAEIARHGAVNYLGPCLLPAEVAAREAAAWCAGRDAAVGLSEAHADRAQEMHDKAFGPDEASKWLARANAFKQSAAASSTLTPPPDLSSALAAREAAAERRGIERAAEADAALIAAVDRWIALRQPLMATAAEHKKRDAQEHEARFRLAHEAAVWAATRRDPAAAIGALLTEARDGAAQEDQR